MIRSTAAAILSLALGADSHPLPTGCDTVTAVAVGPGFDTLLLARLTADVEVEVRRTRSCTPGQPARVRFGWEDGGPITVSVTSTKSATERELRRRVEPSELPADTLSLTLAAVCGELLLEARRESEQPPPPSDPEPAIPAPPVVTVSASFAGEGWAGGQVALGGDLSVRGLIGRLELEGFLGGRSGFERPTSAGTVRSAAFVFGADALVGLVVGALLRLSLLGGGAAQVVYLSGTPSEGWATSPRSAWLVSARLGLELLLRLGSTRWALRLGVDAPLKGIAVTDSQQVLLSISGPGLFAALGGGFSW